MAKFLKIPRSRKNPDGRTFGVFCENHPYCGSGIQGHWRPERRVDVRDEKILAAAMRAADDQWYHHCPKCQADNVALRGPGYAQDPSYDYANRIRRDRGMTGKIAAAEVQVRRQKTRVA